jgi:N-acetylglucosamine kinase-like BadF-type ATPase
MLNITVDGGGTKLLALVFDENHKPLAVGRGLSVNTLFATPEDVKNTIISCINDVLEQIPENYKMSGKIIFENAYITMVGSTHILQDYLQTRSIVKNIRGFSEGETGLFAGALSDNGLLALAGAGSDCFLVKDGHSYSMIGGWGAVLGDEGSGYYLGRETLIAAIRSFDKRGPKTLIEDIIAEDWKLGRMWELTKIYSSPTQRRDVALATKSLSKAIKLGDAVAISIVKKAAAELALQATTLLKRENIRIPLKMTVAGGAWKTTRIMINSFVELVKKDYPETEFVYPHFEPVISGVIFDILKNKPIDEVTLNKLKTDFSNYIFKTDDD